MRADIQIISPYHSSLALNRGGLPEGSSCRHSDPIRYFVSGASHPVISATVARPRRDQQEHTGYSTDKLTNCKYTQLRDIVSQLTPAITRRQGMMDWPSAYSQTPNKVEVLEQPRAPACRRAWLYWVLWYQHLHKL